MLEIESRLPIVVRKIIELMHENGQVERGLDMLINISYKIECH
jgi:hypothetical protein